MVLLTIATDIIQASAALVTIAITFLVYRQQERFNKQEKKIQELSEMVTELKEANEINAERLTLELQLSKNQRMPVFSVEHLDEGELRTDYTRIYLRNSGVDAIDFSVVKYSDPDRIVASHNKDARAGGKLIIELKFKDLKKQGNKYIGGRSDWYIIVRFSDPNGTIYYQKIYRNSGTSVRIKPAINEPPENGE